MQLVEETQTHLIFVDYFNGKPIKLSQSKETGKVSFDANDIAKAFDYNDINDYLGSDHGLDFIAQKQKQNPDFSVMGDFLQT